ncbi:MAG: isochorismatase family protein [Nanoarchaeota archaeon]|nr:isochorismatase family protein [Nanoarchaeota archaeon]
MTSTTEKYFSLLVVDMWWEEEIKDRERGFTITFDDSHRKYGQRKPSNYPSSLRYPSGTLHAGLDAIHDVVRTAHFLKKPIYGVVSDDGYSLAEELLDKSLHPYISKEHLFMKHGYSAFTSKSLTQRLEEDKVARLMIMGFDRDWCVLETIKSVLEQGIEVITSETLMLTSGLTDGDIARHYCRNNTTYLESLVDVYNHLDPEGKSSL